MTATNAKTVPASAAKPADKSGSVEKTVDMSDFNPAAAREEHRRQLADDYGDDVLRDIDAGNIPTE